jgi:hemerythrin superfamily protein
MAQDVIELITQDHREMERLFDTLRSGKGSPSEMATHLTHLLIAHSRAEEERVYPVIAKAAPEEKDEVRHSEEEHQEAEHLALQLQRTDPGDEQFLTLLDQLVASVNHHVRTEESEVLPALREAVDQSRLEELGEEFRTRRQQALHQLENGTPG